MRNLYLFILRTTHIFLFLILAGVSISFIYKSSNYKQWRINAFSKEISAPILTFQNKYTEYLHLQGKNQNLLKQNTMLLNEIYNHRMERSDIKGFEQDDTLLFAYYTAKVIESTVNKQNNFLILDKGEKDGAEPDMGVVSAQGVVGIVKDVSTNFSIVLSLLHSQFTIFAKLKNSDVTGMLTWDGENPKYAQIANIANIETVKMGDTVVTQHSLIFPAGYPIGVVSSVSSKKTGGYFVLRIKILHSFEKMGDVYLIKQNYSEELHDLIKKGGADE
ncbi:MAG: rod shape-determining protein MreC [Lentimicrobiaceae bacterium]|nr:rod shape-determining protein MreC [Lentimicrobiaceae bacterium]